MKRRQHLGLHRPDVFFTAAQQVRLSHLMERFREARNVGDRLAENEQKELERLIEAELEGTIKRMQFLLERREEMTKLAVTLKKDYPDAFVESETPSPLRTDLAFQAGENQYLFVMEYEMNEGYGISRLKSPADGFLRGYEFFFSDFVTARQCFLSLIESH